MPRGEHLAEFNRKRAEERTASENQALGGLPGNPMDLGPAEVPEDGPSPTIPFVDPEMERLRARNLELLEELTTLRAQQTGPIFPTARPIIQRPMPPNYGVWLGPEPPEDVQLCLSARGRVRCIPKREEFTMIDGDGHGKKTTVTGTTHGGTTSSYIDSGYTAIEFTDRCPLNHKYAGRLYARIDCPEHAAWLQLTAGKDREGHQLFVWFLVTPFKSMYDQLKRSNMRRKEIETIEVEDVMSRGEEMPIDLVAA